MDVISRCTVSAGCARQIDMACRHGRRWSPADAATSCRNCSTVSASRSSSAPQSMPCAAMAARTCGSSVVVAVDRGFDRDEGALLAGGIGTVERQAGLRQRDAIAAADPFGQTQPPGVHAVLDHAGRDIDRHRRAEPLHHRQRMRQRIGKAVVEGERGERTARRATSSRSSIWSSVTNSTPWSRSQRNACGQRLDRTAQTVIGIVVAALDHAVQHEDRAGAAIAQRERADRARCSGATIGNAVFRSDAARIDLTFES